MSVPPNTEWMEQSNPNLEMICSERRNQFSLESLGNLFFKVVLNFPVKDVTTQKKWSFPLRIFSVNVTKSAV